MAPQGPFRQFKGLFIGSLHPPSTLDDFSRWIEERSHPLAERWFAEIEARAPAWNEGVRELLQAFMALFLELLPASLGPLREQAEPLWLQTAELFGSLAARRGLAAGEVMEEFQVLREALIRLLWADPPQPASGRTALREALRLNRILDRGVTRASIGHTDALFFALFQGSGVPEHLTDDARYEIREQLHAIQAELTTLERSMAVR